MKITEEKIRQMIRLKLIDEGLGDTLAGAFKDKVKTTNQKIEKSDVSSVGGDAATRAENEFKRWGGKKEGDPSMKDTLSAYWKNAGAPDYGTSQPWSAAFISYAVSPPESPDSDFKKSAAHVNYMKAAKKARDEGKTTGFVAYKPEELEGGPDRGDIVCKPRGAGASIRFDGWDNIGSKNHCDIYVGNNQMIGGNLENTSKKVPYNAKKATMIIKKLAEAYNMSEDRVLFLINVAKSRD